MNIKEFEKKYLWMTTNLKKNNEIMEDKIVIMEAIVNILCAGDGEAEESIKLAMLLDVFKTEEEMVLHREMRDLYVSLMEESELVERIDKSSLTDAIVLAQKYL